MKIDMKIDLSSLSDNQLAALIKAAEAEQVRRLPNRWPDLVAFERRASSRRRVPEPSQHEKDFVLHVKAIAAAGDLVRAAERRGVAEIAKKYPDWVERQGLPAEGGTAAWRNLAYRRKIGQAKEQ